MVHRFLNLEVNYLGQIFEDKKLVQSVRSQVPFSINYPNCSASRCIIDISNNLAGIRDEKRHSGATGLFKKIFNIFS